MLNPAWKRLKGTEHLHPGLHSSQGHPSNHEAIFTHFDRHTNGVSSVLNTCRKATMRSNRRKKKPRILVVTPEITHLPNGMGNMANHLQAKGGGLADVSATLISSLFEQGADIHVALPHYRQMFNINIGTLINGELRIYKSKIPNERIHLAEDRVFYYRTNVYDSFENENVNIALVFQREVINNIIPRVQPDLIHCNDWMTGLIPAYARRLNIPCLFTLHNIHSVKCTLERVEAVGIDAAEFWHSLYLERLPQSYEESRNTNPVEFVTSGIFASHYINTVSPSFLQEIIDGKHDFIQDSIRRECVFKHKSGFAAGVLNSPDPSYTPVKDKNLECPYDWGNHAERKRENKRKLQGIFGLEQNLDAPVFFWPSRLDPVQKGCQLLTDILFKVVSKYRKEGLQIVIIANGPYQQHFHDIVHMHSLYKRVAISVYDDHLSRLAYAASDFLLMPSLFEPCGLPQMICQLYGCLPVAHDTGGIHDTVRPLSVDNNSGNGFLFEYYDSNGLSWAIDQAMSFYREPDDVKKRHISRIMRESAAQFNHSVTAKSYMDIYDEMLAMPM